MQKMHSYIQDNRFKEIKNSLQRITHFVSACVDAG